MCKGFNFSLKPGLIKYSEFLLSFELLFRDLKREDLRNENISLIKARLLDRALTSYQNFSIVRDPPDNPTTSEFKPLKHMVKNKNILIQEVDKGNIVTIKLAKFPLPFLAFLPNKYTVIDSFCFAKEICQKDPNLYMASLDVDSLFTNIPLDEIIDIVSTACKMATRNSLTSQSMIFIVCFTSPPKNHFMFNSKYYEQVDGVAMGSPVGPALANIFMISYDFNDFKHVLHRRYVDDIVTLFSSPDHADNFKGYLSPKHLNIIFSIEKGKDGYLPFLDIKIFRGNGKLATNVYSKKTFSRIYTSFKSFLPKIYKMDCYKIG